MRAQDVLESEARSIGRGVAALNLHQHLMTPLCTATLTVYTTEIVNVLTPDRVCRVTRWAVSDMDRVVASGLLKTEWYNRTEEPA